MINFFNQLLCKNLFDECKIIPIIGQPTKFFTITFTAWKLEIFRVDDKELNMIIEMACANMQYIVSKYKDTHAFTEPQFCWQTDGKIVVKIGILENEIYEKMVDTCV